ncbi:MAG: inositol-3-phosphate synthase, partial [Acidobacteriota bacterium]
MVKQKRFQIAGAEGKLAVMLPGLGAVSTTFIAGVEAVRKGLAKPIGSLTQMGTIRLGKRTEHRVPKIRDFVPLAALEDLTFVAWDIFEQDAYQSALHAGVLERSLLESLRTELEAIRSFKAVFDQDFVKKLCGTHVKTGKTKMDLAEQLMEDIEVA